MRISRECKVREDEDGTMTLQSSDDKYDFFSYKRDEAQGLSQQHPRIEPGNHADSARLPAGAPETVARVSPLTSK